MAVAADETDVVHGCSARNCAGNIGIAELLKTSMQYTVPLFQRKYCWRKKDWTQLWHDLRELTVKPSHSLGKLAVYELPGTEALPTAVSVPTLRRMRALAPYVRKGGHLGGRFNELEPNWQVESRMQPPPTSHFLPREMWARLIAGCASWCRRCEDCALGQARGNCGFVCSCPFCGKPRRQFDPESQARRATQAKQAAATDVALLLEMGFADAVARAALLTAGSVHGALNRLLA